MSRFMKSGSFDSALKLFDEMTERDAVTWNIMISGYYRYGCLFESLNFYRQMVSQGIVESSSTFSTVLSICGCAGFFRQGLVAHCRAVVLGFGANVYIGSALVDLYLHMGLVDIALKLFNALQERTLATWNVVLRAFCEMRRSQELMRMYNYMKLDGLEPNGLTFCYLIQGCGFERLVDEGIQLHCCVIKKGLDNSNLFVANAMVDFYSACGSSIDTRKSFEAIPPEDVISWNSMVSVCAANGHLSDALEAFQRMQLWGKKPSVSSFLGFLKLSSVRNNVSFGRQIHCCIFKLGFNILLVQSCLIDMYGKCGDIESSVAVFVSVPERTLECCNPLMTSLQRCGFIRDVIELFGLMVDENIGYDEVTLSVTLKALSSVSLPAGSAYNSSLLHCCAIKSGFESDIAVACSLIDAYSRSGEIGVSRQLFNQVSIPNVICFTSMIGALARNGMGKECLVVLDEMIGKGLKPDKVTYLSVLMGCNHSGLVEEGRLLFDSMQSDHGLGPDRQHYSCMVDLMGRAGLLDEAEKLIADSPWSEDSVMWTSMLRSCRMYQNEALGKRAAKMVMELEPEKPCSWIQASRFYCEMGDFERMRECREIAAARRTARDVGGLSFIQVPPGSNGWV
ncbi:pentatricopeptide repeat-containing protein At4g39530-like isoform X2 [Andrographis paniculata]|nr:pentatricopeptide repeat-containing protein At4g39530-like isoform X2 [Andrographis paniculata]